MDPTLRDVDIWEFAIEHNLIILTKDNDFYEMFLTKETCPKVITFKFGNFTFHKLHQYFTANWNTILLSIEANDFVVAYEDKIKAIK